MLDVLKPRSGNTSGDLPVRPLAVRHRRLLPPDPSFARFSQTHLPLLESICRQWNPGQFSNTPQGYTYLSQFLMHEITAREGLNRRSWKLELDSLYGDGAVIDNTGRFVYRRVTRDQPADLLRDSADGTARIPEFRNDDHLIITQLHLLMQQFHNRVVDHLESTIEFQCADVAERICAAKAFVIASFHNIIWTDLLPRLTHPQVYQYFNDSSNTSFVSIDKDQSALPYELTHGALRFGHAMVRHSYTLNTHYPEAGNVKLAQLFAFTGQYSESQYKGVPRQLAVDWSLFFPCREDVITEKAARITPCVVEPMTGIGPQQHDIVRLSFLAGINKRLSSGQALAKCFMNLGADALGVNNQLALYTPHANKLLKKKLEQHGLWDNTPLWLFLLIEAECPHSAGQRLGPLGSILLCEALRASMGLVDWPINNHFSRSRSVQTHLPPIASMVDLIRFTLTQPQELYQCPK